LLVRLPI